MMATKGDLGTEHTKHFHYFVTEQIQRGIARLAYLPGKIIPADGLTKPLTGPAGRAWALRLLGHRDPNLAQVRGGGLDRVPERAAGTQQRPQPRSQGLTTQSGTRRHRKRPSWD